MKSKHFVALGLVVGGFGVVGLGAGCGNGSVTSTGTGGSSSSTVASSSSKAASTSVATTGSGGSGGSMGGGNHSFDTANMIAIDTAATMSTLQDAATADYYTFTGTKGQRILVQAQAVGLVTAAMGQNDGSIADTVVTLFDSNKMAIARNDDEWPAASTDSVLYTELPADGTYYLTVEDCNSFTMQNTSVCAPVSGIMTFDYTLFLGDLTKLTQKEAFGGTAQDGTTAKAVPVVYTQSTVSMAKPGEYDRVTVDGNFKSTTDTQVFSFTPPANTYIDPVARSRAYFWPQSTGITDGTGSTANVKMWVTDDAAGMHILAESDQNHYTNGDDSTNGPMEFSLPMDSAGLAKPYYLFVKNTAATSTPATDYFFMVHQIGSVYLGQPEKEAANAKGGNDTMATAETLNLANMNKSDWFVDAQIGAPGDVDWFTLTIPATVGSPAAAPTGVFLECSAGRDGDGLLGFNAVLLAADGVTPIINLTEVNPAVKLLEKGEFKADAVTLPASAAGKAAFLKISAAGQDMSTPPNTGTSYTCRVAVFIPAP